MTDAVQETPGIPEGELEEADSQKIRDLFDDWVKRGIIVPDQDAPKCISCQEPLEEIVVTLKLTTVDPPTEIDTQTFRWAKGMHQFMVSPGFFRFVQENWAEFDARCAKCDTGGLDLEIVEEPHGLKFGAVTRMAGNL